MNIKQNYKLFLLCLGHFGLFLVKEIPNILQILMFIGFLAIIVKSAALFYIVSWILYLYLVVKSGGYLAKVQELTSKKQIKKDIIFIWLVLTFFIVLVCNILIGRIISQLLKINLFS